MLETVQELCALNGVSGWEDEVRSAILNRVLQLPDFSQWPGKTPPEPETLSAHPGNYVYTDVPGNVYIFKRGRTRSSRRIMLCAHMDEVGLIVLSASKEGFLRFGCVGGIDRRVLPGKRVYIGEKKVPGIIGLIPTHLTEKDEEKSCPAVDKLYIDIGTGSREAAEALVSPGDFCAFSPESYVLGRGFFKAKALDDRIGCGVMLKLLEQELPCDCTFVFTVQEEVGTRGAYVAARLVQPEVCLVLEGTTATDLPGIGEEKQICFAGKGVVIPFMDRGTIYSRKLVSLLERLCDENHIPRQTKRLIAGGTDGSAIQRSGTGVAVAGLACAVRNIHSPASVCKISEMEDMLKLAGLFLEQCM